MQKLWKKKWAPMMKKSFEFFNPVTRYSKVDYEEVIDGYLTLLIKNPDVVSVYQLGTTAHPGLSDIDLIIIVKDVSRDFQWEQYSIQNLSDKEKYLFMHEPFVVNESLARDLKFLYPMFNLNHLYGKKFKFNEPTPEHYLHFFIQEYVKGFMFWPDRVIRKRKVDLRAMIPLLYSTKYSIDIFKMLIRRPTTEFVNRSEQYIKDVVKMRENFFEMSPSEIENITLDLIYRTKSLNELMFWELNYYITENLSETKKWSVYTGFAPIVVIFNSLIKYKEYLISRFLPPNFSIILSSEDIEKIKNEKIRGAFLERMKIIKEYEDFIYSHGYENFMMLTNLHTKFRLRLRV